MEDGGIPEVPETPGKVSAKRVAVLVLAGIAGFFLLIGLVIWGTGVIKGFAMAQERKKELAPDLARAKELALTYDSVLADPEKAVGEPAVWCLRTVKPGEALTLYGGKGGDPVYISNPWNMYEYAGSRHEDCQDRLIRIKSITPSEFGGGIRLEAEFIAYR